MKPDKIMDGISKEIMKSLKQMGKTTTTDEKLKHSKIVKNLCESLDVFFGFMNEIASYDYDDDEDEDDDDGGIPFDDFMETGPIQ